MEGWHLDKDILVKGNKIYSPETCAFVPQEINLIFKKVKRTLPLGVEQKGKKFSSVFKLGEYKQYLGMFDDINSAFETIKNKKEDYIKEIADKWKDKIDSRVYEAMYNYEVEIDD